MVYIKYALSTREVAGPCQKLQSYLSDLSLNETIVYDLNVIEVCVCEGVSPDFTNLTIRQIKYFGQIWPV